MIPAVSPIAAVAATRTIPTALAVRPSLWSTRRPRRSQCLRCGFDLLVLSDLCSAYAVSACGTSSSDPPVTRSARCLGGINAPSTAPTATTAAPTQIAGTSPSLNAAARLVPSRRRRRSRRARRLRARRRPHGSRCSRPTPCPPPRAARPRARCSPPGAKNIPIPIPREDERPDERRVADVSARRPRRSRRDRPPGARARPPSAAGRRCDPRARPTAGATNSSIAVHGRSSKPASSGE